MLMPLYILVCQYMIARVMILLKHHYESWIQSTAICLQFVSKHERKDWMNMQWFTVGLKLSLDKRLRRQEY